MILERSISEIREDNKEILEEEKKKHKEEAEQLQRKLYDEKESLEVRCVNTSRENEENQQNVKILNDMIITTNKETEDLKSSLELTIGQLSKIRNLNKEEKANFERFNVLKEDERNGLKQQVSCLIDQINELRPPRNEYQSFPSFTDLNSKLTDKEDEINRLMAENINYIEANNSLMDTIQKLGKPIGKINYKSIKSFFLSNKTIVFFYS